MIVVHYQVYLNQPLTTWPAHLCVCLPAMTPHVALEQTSIFYHVIATAFWPMCYQMTADSVAPVDPHMSHTHKSPPIHRHKLARSMAHTTEVSSLKRRVPDWAAFGRGRAVGLAAAPLLSWDVTFCSQNYFECPALNRRCYIRAESTANIVS